MIFFLVLEKYLNSMKKKYIKRKNGQISLKVERIVNTKRIPGEGHQ